MTKNFKTLSDRVREEWTDEAKAVYDASAAAFDAELSAWAELGRMLAHARAEQQLTQPELSAASGIQQAEISRIERGLGNPTATTLTRLAAALGRRLVLQPA